MAEKKAKRKNHKGSENLVPMTQRTTEEQRRIQRAGGVASGERRREKRTMREWAKALGEMPTNAVGLDGEPIDADYAGAVVLEQFRKAVKDGETSAAKFIAELLGEMVQKVEHSGEGVIVQVTDKVLAQEIAKAIGEERR